MRRRTAALTLALLGAVAAPAAALPRSQPARPTVPVESNRDGVTTVALGTVAAGQRRVIIRAARGVSGGFLGRLVTSLHGTVRAPVTSVFTAVIADVPATALSSLRRSPAVAAVEADETVQVTSTQRRVPSYGLDRIDQREGTDGTFTYRSTGRGVTAYVIDSGLLLKHQDFTGRARRGMTVVTDGRGLNDCNGHGTHVSGTLGGTVYGVAKTVSLVPVRVLGCDGTGPSSGLIAALDWVAKDHRPGVPAVANISLEGGGSSALDDAIRAVIADGVTVVVAAGNNGFEACLYSPSRVTEAITVGASTEEDAKASYSNFGSCVDLYAPGSDIISDWDTGPTAIRELSGTSMATPHVAGAAAALLQSAPTATPDQVQATLVDAATPTVTGVLLGTNRLLYADPNR